jgi:ribosomal protein S18 acetylase RimI-like enzyme
VRLRALREHPEAFGSSFEEEHGDDMRRMIGVAPNLSLGGFVGDRLVAVAGYVVPPKVKQRHKGHVVGVYVAPEWRGSGLAPALLGRLIAEARAAGLRMLTLSVTVGNPAARRLYRRLGFVTYGTEPGSLLVDGVPRDEELMMMMLDVPSVEAGKSFR